MKITFRPMRSEARLKLERQGDCLHINGAVYDFSALPEGASLPRAAITGDWLAEDVTRKDNVLHLAVVLPIGKNAPKKSRFPAQITLRKDGPIALPTDKTKRRISAKTAAKTKGAKDVTD